MGIIERFQRGWNAFMNKDPTFSLRFRSNSSYSRPDRVRLTGGNERSIITSIYNRLATDASDISIVHAKLDNNGRYLETIDSGLNYCFNVEANIDQAARSFRKDLYMTMFDEGHVAIAVTNSDKDPNTHAEYDIWAMRAGTVVAWHPTWVRVKLYNDQTGNYEEVNFQKRNIAIVENPFYPVMNEPNSTLQRLKRKLVILDAIDEQAGSGKLDLIVQLPYAVKSEIKTAQAEERRHKIEEQLNDSKYGIAYIDATEKVTQLNRSVENNLMKTIEYLTNELYTQLGFTPEIMNGTADENAMTNYYSRTIEPCIAAVTEELARKYLTKAARNDKQAIKYFRDPFKLVSITALAELVDKFTRNEVMSSNEWRQIVGLKPSSDPRADELRNKNLSQSSEDIKFQNGVEKKDTNNKEGGKDTNGV